jgi:hypothetical protein
MVLGSSQVCPAYQYHPDRQSYKIMASYLREGTVVPEVALVREAVADETELALLDILLDGV